MQKLAEICIKRPVFATMLILMLVVLGLDAYRKLGVDLFPKVEFPIVTVTTTLRGASPEEVETQLSKRIEEAVNTVSGIDELQSMSAEGLSRVIITFVLDKDMKTVPLGLQSYMGAMGSIDWTATFAAVCVTITPLLLALLVLNRAIIYGIQGGATKG